MDSFTSGLDAFTRIQGIRSRKEAGRRAEDENARRQEAHDLRMAQVAEDRRQAEFVAEADAQAQGRRATSQAKDNTFGGEASADRLAKIVKRQQGGPFAGAFASLTASAMDAMDFGAAAGYIEQVESRAASMPSDEARGLYLDSALSMFSGEAAQREVTAITRQVQSLVDRGALPPEAAEQVGQGVEALKLGLSTSATRSDFDAVRGGTRKLHEGIQAAAQSYAHRKAVVSQAQALEQRAIKLGNLYIENGLEKEGLAQLELASKFAGMNEKDLSGAIRESGAFSGDDFTQVDAEKVPSLQAGLNESVEGPSDGGEATASETAQNVPRGTEGKPEPKAKDEEVTPEIKAERSKAIEAEMAKRAQSQVKPALDRVREDPSPENFKAFKDAIKKVGTGKGAAAKQIHNTLRSLLSADPDFKDPEIQAQLDRLLDGTLFSKGE